jgi:hypothetical protein
VLQSNSFFLKKSLKIAFSLEDIKSVELQYRSGWRRSFL